MKPKAAPPEQKASTPAPPNKTSKRTTVFLDPSLLARAQEACGASSTTETINQGLLELVRKQKALALADLAGTDPSFETTTRRRA